MESKKPSNSRKGYYKDAELDVNVLQRIKKDVKSGYNITFTSAANGQYKLLRYKTQLM